MELHIIAFVAVIPAKLTTHRMDSSDVTYTIPHEFCIVGASIAMPLCQITDNFTMIPVILFFERFETREVSA